jgi:hypothetical protein
MFTRNVLLAAFCLATYFALPFALPAENRPGTIDAILLIDKSLSMAPAIDRVKRYAAGEVIEAILVPGDRLIIEVFYGKVERLFAGTIRSESDKAEAIRSLNGIVADGHFTDIGAALDRASKDLDELGSPDRPKYILLLTDERQEAPAGSPYQAKNYVLVHPALTYTRRLDLGPFRAITVGLDIASKVDQAATGVMKMLEEPPVRDDKAFPELEAGSSPALSAVAESSPAQASGSGTAASKTVAGRPGGATANAAWNLGMLPLIFFGALVLAAILGAAILLRRKKKRNEERNDS